MYIFIAISIIKHIKYYYLIAVLLFSFQFFNRCSIIEKVTFTSDLECVMRSKRNKLILLSFSIIKRIQKSTIYIVGYEYYIIIEILF